MRRYSLRGEIDAIKLEMGRVAELSKFVESRGWKQVATIFSGRINKFWNDIYELCNKPGKNEMEIRCKKMVADALGEILAEITGRVSKEEFLKEQLDQKSALMAEQMDRQKLNKL
jgi:hypothetical protein